MTRSLPCPVPGCTRTSAYPASWFTLPGTVAVCASCRNDGWRAEKVDGSVTVVQDRES